MIAARFFVGLTDVRYPKSQSHATNTTDWRLLVWFCNEAHLNPLSSDHQVDIGFEGGKRGCGARSDGHRHAALLARREAAEQEV